VKGLNVSCLTKAQRQTVCGIDIVMIMTITKRKTIDPSHTTSISRHQRHARHGNVTPPPAIVICFYIRDVVAPATAAAAAVAAAVGANIYGNNLLEATTLRCATRNELIF